MINRGATLLAFAAATLARWRGAGRATAGMAAVEFALILPLMLTLYFGCVALSQGFEAARKTQLLSRTLADLTARQIAGQETSGNCASYSSAPCLLDTDIQNIFNASTAVLYPFTGSPNMTITEIIFDNVSSANKNCCVAKVMWSVGSGPSPTLRQCGTLTQSSNGVNGAALMPAGVYPPTSSNNTSGPDYYLIVADVSYSYSPGVGFAFFAWGQSPNGGAGYTFSRTIYMTPRNSATAPIQWTPGGTISSANYVTCSVNVP